MTEIVVVITKVALGLFAGSLLTEAVILVPFWRSIPADEFQRQHHRMGPSLYRYFAPLTLAAVGLMMAAIVLTWPVSPAWMMAGCFVAAAFLSFPLYFKRANASFAKGGLSADNLRDELRRWSRWHWVRTIMVIVAFGLVTSS